MSAVEAAKQIGDAVQAIDAHRLEIRSEDGFHRPLPAPVHPQLLRDARLLIQRLRLQPLRHLAGRLAERRLLQGLGRDLGTQSLLPSGSQCIEAVGLFTLSFARAGQLRQQLLQLARRPLPGVAGLGSLLRQHVQRHVGLQPREGRAFGLLPFLLLQQSMLLILKLFDAGPLDLGLALAAADRLRMRIPGLLPLRQRLLTAHQQLRGRALFRMRNLQSGNHRGEFLAQALDLTTIALDDAVEFLHLGLGLI